MFGLCGHVSSTFPRISSGFHVDIVGKERSYFVFHKVEVHSDARRLEYKEKKEEEEEKMITPGLLISLWAPLAQSVSLQSSLQPSPPSHTRSSSVMQTQALSARVCYARRETDLTISSL